MENILLAVAVDDDFLINPLIQEAIELAQPLAVTLPAERHVPPHNENYYEETISYYMGDLFIDHFRMTRAAFENLTNLIANGRPINQHTNIPIEKRILFTIWVVAKQESLLAVGDRFNLAKSTAHGVFVSIIGVLAELIPQYIRWPRDHEQTINTFLERSHGFPNIVGAIDGCHIAIKQPARNPVDYHNRKGYNSIILQAICDHKLLFMDIFVGVPGRAHDARVFQMSPIFESLNNNENPLLQLDYHLVGDSAYPLMSTLLTPLRDNGHLNPYEINFNTKLSRVRSTIERAFGRLKGKFRRLLHLDIANPDFGVEIIAAACVLHNYIIEYDNVLEENHEVEEEILVHEPVGEINGNNYHQDQEKRLHIALNLPN